MKKVYKIQKMTVDGYDRMMCGSYDFCVLTRYIEAEDEQQAIDLAQEDGFVVNTKNVQIVEPTADIQAEIITRETVRDNLEKEIAELEKYLEAKRARLEKLKED